MDLISRRSLLTALPTAATLPWILGMAPQSQEGQSPIYPEFPAQSPERVREMVGVSHGNVDRVKALLAESPALAKATWDWGFGDWETALGAASHVGNREIAELLIKHGARPDIFTFAMLGKLEVVRSYIEAVPGIQRITGPHGFTLMHHARQAGQEGEKLVKYLEEVGDADPKQVRAQFSSEESAKYTGTYVFGSGPTETLEVFVPRSGILSVRRGADGSARALVKLGINEFHPVGAEAVRLTFEIQDGASVNIRIIDGPFVLVAKK